MDVQTTIGLVPAEQLEVTDRVDIYDNARKVTTTWKKDGVMVREDVTVSILRGHDMGSEKGRI